MIVNTRRGAPYWSVIDLMRDRNIETIGELQAALSPYVSVTYDQARRLTTGEFFYVPPIDILDALCRVFECDICDVLIIRYRQTDDKSATSAAKSGSGSSKPAPHRRKGLHCPAVTPVKAL